VEDSGRWEAVPLDVVFPVLHGTSGEDGAIQGLLELSGIPYVGCDVASSAICMDKSLAYVIAASAGIRTPRFRTVDARDPLDAYDTGEIGYPAFVKPARSGSSFGVSKVERAEDLAGAVQCARGYDSKVLIEEAVVGSEVGCAVLGEGPDVIVGEVDRIALSHGFFRIHQEDAPELGSHNSTPIVPADISPEQRTLVQRTARADMFLTADGDVVLNEVNTLPGLTSYSRYPRMMAAADLPLRAVIDRLVALAQAGRRR
jgi:D-alanine--(R)-lactate ligase